MSSQLQPPNPFDTPAPSTVGPSGMNTPNTPPNDDTLLAPDTHTGGPYTEKTPLDPRRASRTKWILAGAGVFIVALIVIIVPVYFTVIKPKNTSSQSSISSPNENSGNTPATETPPPETHGPTTGGDGSIVTTANGNFTYKNPFGGFWVYDPKDPFNNGAKAQVRTHSLPGIYLWHPRLIGNGSPGHLDSMRPGNGEGIPSKGEWMPRKPELACLCLPRLGVSQGQRGWLVRPRALHQSGTLREVPNGTNSGGGRVRTLAADARGWLDR